MSQQNKDSKSAEDLNEKLKDQISDYQTDRQESKQVHYKGYRMDEETPSGRKKISISIKKVILIVILIIVALIVAAVVSFFVLKAKGEKELTNTDITVEEGEESKEEEDFIVYNGEKYCYNTDITTIMCIGVDTENIEEEENYRSGYMADTLFLMVINTDDGSTTMIPVSRYTMTDVGYYDENGEYKGVTNRQVGYAYAYGDGREVSGKNTAKAVSRMLGNIPISGFVAIDMNGIGALNNLVGGVTVTLSQDLTYLDSGFTAGSTVTLSDQQAVRYVRDRVSETYTANIDANAPRMERQIQYLSGLIRQTLDQTKSDPSLPLTMYNVLGDYMVTSISAAETTYLVTLMAQHGLNNTVVTLPSVATKGEKYTEVYLEEDKIQETILNVFYEKVNE